MATTPDYYIETFDTGSRPYPWSWELRRRSQRMGVRFGAGGFQSQAAAEYAGKQALERFLRELSKEERHTRRRKERAANIGNEAPTSKCFRCEDSGWVCENHADRPWDGKHACGCGGAGAPCPACNAPGEGKDPRLPSGYKTEFDKDGWRN